MEIHKEEQSANPELHRHMTVAAFTFIGLLLAGIGIYALTSSFIESRRSSISSQLSTSLSHVNATPDPAGITFRQKNGDTRAIANLTARSLQSSQESFENTAISVSLYPIAAIRPGISVSDVASLRNSKQSIGVSFGALRSYSDTLEGLVPFFEYSARLDTQEYSSSSTDTQERMDRLTAGLTSLEQTLSSQPTNSEIEQLLDITTAAQNAQQALLASGDTTAFVSTMEPLQEDAKEIVLRIYQQTISPLRQQLTEMNRSVQKTLR